MSMKKTLIASVVALSVVSTIAIQTTQAFSFGSILKVGGIAILVDKFAEPLNNFINTLTAKHSVSSDYATKVVPIIVVGSGTYTGAAQITGPQASVDQTQAVLQIEGNFSGDKFRIKALIPIDSKNPTSFNRVQGVGVSAQIDVKI
ncbi:hypothetical protein [Anaerosinus massiliensis]|uniref:hypothetical protein n=1 Tax=Massilibacillus massiliensis TaxID=1806837 RepID=UPI000B143168|nr:hypothetical protein [Massilibacillus massiliensis]